MILTYNGEIRTYISSFYKNVYSFYFWEKYNKNVLIACCVRLIIKYFFHALYSGNKKPSGAKGILFLTKLLHLEENFWWIRRSKIIFYKLWQPAIRRCVFFCDFLHQFKVLAHCNILKRIDIISVYDQCTNPLYQFYWKPISVNNENNEFIGVPPKLKKCCVIPLKTNVFLKKANLHENNLNGL